MKPKDLLEYLEKGDRTMEHLVANGKVTTSPPGEGALNMAIQNAFGQMIDSQLANSTNQMWQQAYASSQMIGNSQIGGSVRW